MQILLAVLAGIAVLTVVALVLSLRIVQQYQEGLGAFLSREQAAVSTVPAAPTNGTPSGR